MSIAKEAMLKLQNGSDVRGIATEGVEGQHVNLTGEAVNLIAQAFALWLAQKKNAAPSALKIGVGHDSRVSAPALKAQVLEGLAAQGAAAAAEETKTENEEIKMNHPCDSELVG